LIVAIGNYDESTGWTSISSLNDVALIENSLRKQGFDNFSILRDSEATKVGIVSAFDEYINLAQKGDIYVIHFSSHGQQIMDNNGDELDGYDEAIVAYGAPAYYSDGYDGELHLRDEELGDKLDQLRTKVGKTGDILVIVDACHSGTATRGKAARGGKKALAPPGYSPAKRGNSKEIGVFEPQSNNSRGLDSEMAPMVIISAARADELNYEYNGYGSLSLAVARSLENLSPKNSYRTIFSKIAKEMSIIAPNQNPAIEGDIDRSLFAGESVAQEDYYTLSSINNDAAVIESGTLMGLNEASTISIYPSGTTTPEAGKQITSGTITFADAFSCNAILSSGLDGKVTDYWVFVENKSFGNVSIPINLNTINKSTLKKSLTEFTENFALASVDSENATFNVTSNKFDQLSLVFSQSGLLFKGKIPSTDGFKQLKKVLSSYAQGRFLKELEISNSDYNIEVSLIPVAVNNKEVTDTLDISTIMDEGGIPSFSTSTKALLQITNHSSFPVYFNIIDIQPDGVVNPIVPNPRRNENAKDYRISAGQTIILKNKIISFGPPYGTETFKIFASYEPLNFAPILVTRGESSARGNLSNNLEKLFLDSYTLSRGADIGALQSDMDACTFSYVFKITPIK
ncbi:caspase family protein, partial [Bacteroidia bacterium]|nr:caspase family protein [Bacteroidia bacterium]